MFYFYVKGTDPSDSFVFERREWSMMWSRQSDRKMTERQYQTLKGRFELIQSMFPSAHIRACDIQDYLLSFVDPSSKIEDEISEFYKIGKYMFQYRGVVFPKDLIKEILLDIIANRNKTEWLFFRRHFFL